MVHFFLHHQVSPKEQFHREQKLLSHRQMTDTAFVWKDEADVSWDAQHAMTDIDWKGCMGSTEGGFPGPGGLGSEGKRPKGGGTPIAFEG